MKIKVKNFDLKKTIEGGQIFNYSHANGHYFVIHSGFVIKIRQNAKDELEFSTFPDNGGRKAVENLLNFNKEYFPIIRKYFKEGKILKSYEKNKGIRIVSMEPWECLLGFICSQMNNMPRIRQMVKTLCKKAGTRVNFDGMEFYLFPTPSQIVKMPKTALHECKLGYRSDYIFNAALAISNGYHLEKLKKLDYVHAKSGLMMLPGIGEKVADCVLVFSLGFSEGFPVDIWIKRIMQKLYFHGKEIPETKIGEYARNKFRKDAAIVHEFLFANREALV